MNPLLTHLTEAQLYSLLDRPGHDNDASREAAPHLAACAGCRAEFEALRNSLSNFRLAAEGIALRLAPIRPPALPARAPLFPMPQTAWAAGVVAALALCVASVTIFDKPATPAHPVAVVAPVAVPGTPSDDALLEGIDQDLSTSVPPPLAPLDVASSSANSTSTN